jgi:hypothetical protein
MPKTKEQILNEQKTIEEIKQMPTRMKLESLMNLKEIMVSTTPIENVIMSEQQWKSIWNEDEMEIIKHKILTIVRDL